MNEVEARPTYGAVFWTGLVVGWSVIGYAVVGILNNVWLKDRPGKLLVWVLGGLAVHDALLASFVTVVGLLLALPVAPMVARAGGGRIGAVRPGVGVLVPALASVRPARIERLDPAARLHAQRRDRARAHLGDRCRRDRFAGRAKAAEVTATATRARPDGGGPTARSRTPRTRPGRGSGWSQPSRVGWPSCSSVASGRGA